MITTKHIQLYVMMSTKSENKIQMEKYKIKRKGVLFLFASIFYIISGTLQTFAADAVGKATSSLSVSNSGAAVYDIKIKSPDGGSFSPQISLSYNSQSAGYGLAGYGFTISGLSVITKGGKDMFHDKVLTGKYSYDKIFYLDGKRLIGGEYNNSAYHYTVEGDPYTNVAYYEKGSDCWFEVKNNKGETYIYGKSANSRLVTSGHPGNHSFVEAWYLERAEDKYSNYITYKYINTNYWIRPELIEYGLNDEHSRGIKNCISFEYESLGDNYREFAIGPQKGKIDQYISSITTTCNGNIYRKYVLSYNETSDNGQKKWTRLTSVVEKNGNEETLPAIKIDWKHIPTPLLRSIELNNVNTSINDGFDTENDKTFTAIDLNNDGVSDIIRISYCTFEINQGYGAVSYYNWNGIFISLSKISSTGAISYDAPIRFKIADKYVVTGSLGDINRAIGSISAIDIDGDGKNDILYTLYNQMTGVKKICYTVINGKEIKTNGGHELASSQFYSLHDLAYSSEAPLITAYDKDGDGKDEIIVVEKGRNKYGACLCWTYKSENGKLKQISEEQIYIDNTPQKMFCGDYNNDGLTDLILLYNGGYKIMFHKEGSTGSSISRANFGNAWRVSQGDFDGDGLLDFVYNKEGDNYLWIAHNNGNGTFSCNRTIDIGMSNDGDTSLDNDRFSLNVFDIDHDGLSDIVVSKANYYSSWFTTKYKNTSVKWLLSTGSSFKVLKSFTKDKEDVGKENYVFVGDFDGDGAFELANYGGDLSTSNNSGSDDVLRIYKSGYAYDIPTYGKIKTIEDGLGNKYTIQYKNTTDPQVYSNTIAGKYPVMSYTIPMPVVSTLTSTCSNRNIVTNYLYKDMKLHIAGKGMLGFNYISKDNTTLGEKTTTEFTKWDEEKWIPTEVTENKYVGKESSTTVATSVIKPVGNNYFTYVSHKKITDLDGFTSEVITNYDVNEDRAFIIDETVKNDGDNMYKKVVYDKHVQILGAYLPRKVTKTQKHSDDKKTYTQYTTYEYDDWGNPTKVVNNAKTVDSLVTFYTYNPFYGFKTSEKTIGRNVTTIVKNYDYDSSGRFITREWTSPASSELEYNYNIFGNLTREQDKTDPNNILLTVHKYNGWNEITRTDYPDKNYVEYSKTWESAFGAGYYSVTATPNNAPQTKTIYDPFGREVSTTSVGLKGVEISKETTYDSKGQVSSVVNKNGKLTLSDTYTYDSRGRKIKEVSSTGASTTYSYDKRTVKTTSAGRTTTAEYDAWGNIKTTVDPMNFKVTYTYLSNGKPSSIITQQASNLSGFVKMKYDGAGNKIEMFDCDAGVMTYTYAADGTILSETDARGVTTSYTYDNIGRLIKKVYKDKTGSSMTDNFEYCKGTHLFSLAKQSRGQISKSYEYDIYGRVIKVTAVKGQKEYTTSYTYNDKGQKSEVTYPGNMVFKYTYDSDGFLSEILYNKTKPVYSIISYDGLTMKYSTVAGVMEKTIDKDGYPSEYILHGKDSQEFTYDKNTGNLMSRFWQNGSEVMLDETFKYDKLDRLTSVYSGGKTILGIDYYSNGNICEKSDVGFYDYGDADKKHALTRITDYRKKDDVKLVRTTFGLNGKISSISMSDYDVRTYSYGPDNERIGSSDGNTGQHVYLDDYEKITKNNVTTEYYFLENDVIVTKKTGTSGSSSIKLYQAVTDNLGSILAVYGETNNLVFKAKYDVWGKQTVYKNALGLYRGYTGHEMLPGFELINMGGRMYDPVVARFLSCDNFVQEPTNSQNFNRYSYCLNNPLKYTDPSGNAFVIDDVTIAFMAYSLASSMMTAAATGQNVWRAAGINILSQGATLGIGAAFGNCGGVGYEILRAGAHGFTSGVVSSLQGGSFGVGFASGAFSSAAGSAAQALKLGEGGMLVSSVLIGGTSAYISGGDFLQGALNGLQVGLLNHRQHDSGGGDGDDDDIPVFLQAPDPTPASEYSLDWNSIASAQLTALDGEIGGLRKLPSTTTFGDNFILYVPGKNCKGPFNGNQYVRTSKIWSAGTLAKASKRISIVGYAVDGYDIGRTAYQKGVFTKETGVKIASKGVSWGGAAGGAWLGAKIGTCACPGYGTIIGAGIGSVVGGIGGEQLIIQIFK